jgi:hypothetical protein
MSPELDAGIRKAIGPGELETLFSNFDFIAEVLDRE